MAIHESDDGGAANPIAMPRGNPMPAGRDTLT